VEDERIVGRDLQGRLRRLGYEVPAVAATRDEALQLAEHFRPDLVLMDIHLNGTPQGIEAAREIRENFDLPVVYLTGHSDAATLENAKQTEPFGYVLKPFEDRELMVAIETAMNKHHAERRLRETERWLAATLCSIGDAVITLDWRLEITFLNKVAEEITGWTVEEAIGKSLFAVFRLAGESAETETFDLITGALVEGTASARSRAAILVGKHGRRIFVDSSVAPIQEDGENSGIVLVFRDVTNREEAQREIQERSEQQAAANRLAQRALDELDLPTLMHEACGMVSRLLRADVAEVLELAEDRLHVRSIVSSTQDSAGGPLAIIDSAGARHILQNSEPSVVQCFRIGDKSADLLLSRYGAVAGAAVLIGVPRKPYGVLGAYSHTERTFTGNQLEFLRAIAYTLSSALDRKRAEERIEESRRLESIGVLAGGVAHDYNNLLSIIIGNADEARRDCSDCAPMRAILSAAERAAELTRQLLAYSGKGRFVSQVVSLSDLVAQFVEPLRGSIPAPIELDLALGSGLPALNADPNQIRQILENLIDNAVEAMPPGAGRVTVATGVCELTAEMAAAHAAIDTPAPGQYVLLEVADEGCGMDEATKARIFDPFFTTKFTGRGLGLAGVQGIVRAYRGLIEVESTVGRGSRFRVFLPARSQAGPPREPAGGAQLEARSSQTVLVVDDEPMIRRMLARMLGRLGFQVLQAESGKQALEVLAAAPAEPALALLDLVMPLTDGGRMLPLLHAQHPNLKIIATSGYTEEEARRVLRSEYIASFLQKPYKPEVLAEAIRKALH
jgi:PAS domain S-box-containing protein